MMVKKGTNPPGQVRLRTLVYIRWFAVVGQLVTILTVKFGLGFELPIVPCLAAVAVSAGLNAALMLTRPLGQTLSDRAATQFLAYDLVQLTVLLFLTGGLQNPFSILILASVTVSAAILSRFSTAMLGLLAGIAITFLALVHQPIPWRDSVFTLPDFYLLGIWQALIVAALFISVFVGSVAEEARAQQSALAQTQLGLEREQRMSSLGGLAAAAAHELGTPLATIAVVAKEMQHDVQPNTPMAEDVQLLLEQTTRCRDILADLSRKPEADGGEPFTRLSLSTMLEEAARPHEGNAVRINFDCAPMAEFGDSSEPVMDRSPEFLHSVGTLIKNAAQFASKEVVVRGRWDEETVTVEIMDDGPGFSEHLLDRLGEPYVSSRTTGKRDGEHMGLGVFIAQTLLNRMGATIRFANQDWWDWWGAGAVVHINWPRKNLEQHRSEANRGGNTG